MSQILERFLVKQRLPEAAAAFAGFIVGNAAFLFATPDAEGTSHQQLHELEGTLTGIGTAIAAGGIVAFIRSRRNSN